MLGRRQVRVEGTVVEAETPVTPHASGVGPTDIILDVHTPEGELVRVAFKQHLFGRNLLEPEAGDVVPVDWDPKRGTASLALKGDARYDLALQKRQQKDAFKAVANAPAGTPSQPHEPENEDVAEARQIWRENLEKGFCTQEEFDKQMRDLDEA
jgi:hypothetical protein